MKYLKNFKKYSLNEEVLYDIYAIEINWVVADEYARNNYNFTKIYEELGEDIFEYMSDHHFQQYYDSLIDDYIKNTSVQDVADYGVDRIKDFISENEWILGDDLDYDKENELYDDVVDEMTIDEMVKLIDNNAGAKHDFLYKEAISDYDRSIQEMFSDWCLEDKDYYNNLKGYFDEDKVIDNFINDEDAVREFYLENIQTDEKLLDFLIEDDEDNLKYLFGVLEKGNKYGKSKKFQSKYIAYMLKYEYNYDESYFPGEDVPEPSDEDMVEIITNIDSRFGIAKELSSKYSKYLMKKRAFDFNL